MVKAQQLNQLAAMRRKPVLPVHTRLGSGLATAAYGIVGRKHAVVPAVTAAASRPVDAGPASFETLFKTAAERAGVDEHLVKAVAEVESGFRPDARSTAGAVGLMQLMPSTAKALGVNPYDPAANVAGGARYLRTMLDKFGSVPLALAAYNAGPGAVEKYGGIPPYKETQAYVERVMQATGGKFESESQNGMEDSGGRRNLA